jgi:hypothetical protein
MWKRWTICLIMGHKYNKIPYNEHDDSGTFLRCARCQHENHIGQSVRPTII